MKPWLSCIFKILNHLHEHSCVKVLQSFDHAWLNMNMMKEGKDVNRSFLHSAYWTGTSMQGRLMRGNIIIKR